MRRFINNLANALNPTRKSPAAARRERRASLRVEALESRELLSTTPPLIVPPIVLPAPDAIQAKYQSLGGAAGFLGKAVTGELATPSGGLYQVYQGGAIYWSPGTGAHDVYGAIGAEYGSLGGAAGYGLPTSDEMNVPGVPGGRMNTFQNGHAIYWSAATGAHAVYGAIGAEYGSLGGAAGYGLPTSDEMNVPGVSGARMNTFENGHAIYWSAWTGAHAVYGAIGGKYNSLGGAAGYGLPTSDEMNVPGVPGGRMNTFENGHAVYWSAATGAHAVYGAIGGEYNATVSETDAYGKSVRQILGAPTSDEMNVSGVAGARMNTFQGGAIYWSPATAAHVVYGAIGGKYNSLGGPAGSLGLPTSDELADGPGGRMNTFQNGAIYWSAATGALDSITKHFVIDTQHWYDGFGGTVDLTLKPTGQVTVTWHVHDSTFEDYDFQLSAVLKSGGTDPVAIAAQKSGHVSGHIFSLGGESDRNFDSTETFNSPLVKDTFGSFALGSDLQVFERHRGDITGTLEDIGLAALKWGVGTALTPALPVIALGVELGSLVSTGSLVPGARLLDGVLWLAGPSGTLIALAADAITKIGSREMVIPKDAYDWAQQNVFKGTLPPRDQILITDTIGPSNRPFTFKNALGKYVVNLGPKGFDNPWTFNGKAYGQTLIHELTHVWQMAHNPDLLIYAEALDAKLIEVTKGKDVEYTPGPAGPPFSTFNLEQQARIVENWYVGSLHAPGTDDPLHPGTTLKVYEVVDNVRDPYYLYIAGNIRAGIP